MLFICILCTEPRGHNGSPCMPDGGCFDENADCTSSVCLCAQDFFEKNGICSKYLLFPDVFFLFVCLGLTSLLNI